MNKAVQDEFFGRGGSYVVGADGVRECVEHPTKDHPEGNTARDRHGKALDAEFETRVKKLREAADPPQEPGSPPAPKAGEAKKGAPK